MCVLDCVRMCVHVFSRRMKHSHFDEGDTTSVFLNKIGKITSHIISTESSIFSSGYFKSQMNLFILFFLHYLKKKPACVPVDAIIKCFNDSLFPNIFILTRPDTENEKSICTIEHFFLRSCVLVNLLPSQLDSIFGHIVLSTFVQWQKESVFCVFCVCCRFSLDGSCYLNL